MCDPLGAVRSGQILFSKAMVPGHVDIQPGIQCLALYLQDFVHILEGFRLTASTSANGKDIPGRSQICLVEKFMYRYGDRQTKIWKNEANRVGARLDSAATQQTHHWYKVRFRDPFLKFARNIKGIPGSRIIIDINAHFPPPGG